MFHSPGSEPPRLLFFCLLAQSACSDTYPGCLHFLKEGSSALSLLHSIVEHERAACTSSQDIYPRHNFTKMSSDRRRSDHESPSTSCGSSDAARGDPAAPEPGEQEERKPSATQQKKNTKLCSKMPSKLPTNAKRIQELAEITLDPPPDYSAGPKGDNIYE